MASVSGWVDHSYPQFYTWSERYGNRSEQERDDMIDDFIKLIPTSLMDESGTVFNSGRQTFESPSGLYILGANPGGKPKSFTKDKYTVRQNVEDVLQRWSEDYSPYRDQRWGGFKKPGNHPMQRGLLHLFSRVNRRPEEVPASEVVFLRSKDLTELRGRFDSIAEQCWPFHQAVIENLEVKVIVCLGRKVGGFVRRQMAAVQRVCEYREELPRRWRSFSHKNHEGIFVVTLAHPSRSEWSNERCDPTRLVVNALHDK